LTILVVGFLGILLFFFSGVSLKVGEESGEGFLANFSFTQEDVKEEDLILLDPTEYNLPITAKERPDMRTARTATFETSPNKFAAVGVMSYMFAKDNLGRWVIPNQNGENVVLVLAYAHSLLQFRDYVVQQLQFL